MNPNENATLNLHEQHTVRTTHAFHTDEKGKNPRAIISVWLCCTKNKLNSFEANSIFSFSFSLTS